MGYRFRPGDPVGTESTMRRVDGACARRYSLATTSRLGALSVARGGVMSELLLDAAGRRRYPATLPGFHPGRPPRKKGMRSPADPPTIEEIVTVDAPRRRRRPRSPAARLGRCAVARWPADL